MAEQVQESRVVVQPTSPEQPIPTNVFEQGASVFGQAAAENVRAAAVSGQEAALQYNKASAAFDKSLDTYNKYAEQKAAEDAPASIKRDGNGNIIPPSSFYPPGISSRAYAESYRATSTALYKSFAEQELVNHSALMREKYPSDPTAYAAAMAEKRQAMQMNLDPAMAPWINVRAEQIQAQGVTQIAVGNQSAKNAVTKESYDRGMRGIADDAGRLAASTPQAQGAGGSQAGYDNNSGNITVSAETYHGGKGLPYAGPSGLKFETFASAEHGVAASYNLIKRRIAEAGGTMSFTDLVNKWDGGAAPDVKANYAAAMAKAAGLQPGDAVPIDSAAGMAAVIKAQNQFEKGKQTVSDTAIENGIKLANGDKAVPLTNQATNQVAVLDPKTVAQLTEQALNTGVIAQRISDLRDLAKSGARDPALVERDIQEIRIEAQLKAMGEQIRNSADSLYGKDGYINQGAIADAEERIRQIAASPQYAGREKLVTDTLMGHLQYAQTIGSRRANQIQVNDKRAMEPQQRQMMTDAAAAAQARLNSDTVTAKAITDRLEAQARGYLNNASLSDSVAMQLAQTAMQTGSISRGALQESFTNRIQSLNQIINDPNPNSAPPAAKERANAELLTINSDPTITRDLTAGQRGFAQAGIDKMAMARLSGDWAGIMLAAPKGETSPMVFDRMLQQGVQEGRYGDHPGTTATLAQLSQVSAINRAAWEKNMAAERLATDGLEATARGRPVTDSQAEAIKDKIRFALPGDGVPDPTNPGAPAEIGATQTFDPAKPGHLPAAIAYVQRTGIIPDRVKDAAEHMPKSPDGNVMGPWVDTYSQLSAVLAQKSEQLTGIRPRTRDVQAMVGTMMGDATSTYLGNVVAYGAQTAFDIDKANAAKPSVTGATGQPAGSLSNEVDKAADNFTKTLSQDAFGATWAAKLDGGRLPFTDSWKATERERAAEALFSVSPGAKPSLLGRVIGAAPGQKFTGGITFDDDAKVFLTGQTTAQLASDGHAIAAQAKNERPADYAFRQAVSNNAQMLELRDNGDGTATIGLKTFSKAMAEKASMEKFTPEVTQGFLDSFIQGERRQGRLMPGGITAPLMGAQYDPKSLVATPLLEPNNAVYWQLSGRDKNTGAILNLGEYSQNDPRFRAEALAAHKEAWLAFSDHWTGSGPKPDPGQLAKLGSDFIRIVQTPIQTWLNENNTTAALAKNTPAFQVEFDKRVRQLAAENGRPLEDLAATARKVMDDPKNSPLAILPPAARMGTGPEAAAEAAARAAVENPTARLSGAR